MDLTHCVGPLGSSFRRLERVFSPGIGSSLEVGKPAQAKPAASSPQTSASSAPRLSIVVLPFANIGGDLEQEYFVDGVTESLTTDLSRIAGSFVIARNSAFSYKGKSADVRQIGRELNVRYALEGSMQRGGNRLRVNVQLVDAETGNHIWAERFDKPVADFFDMQDEIVSMLANTLNAQLIAAEARRAEYSPHPVSMDLYFQGMAWVNKGPSPEYLVQARAFFERALALDPSNVEALVGMATVEAQSAAYFITDDRAAPRGGRSGFDQGAVARAESCPGALPVRFHPNLYQPSSPRHRRVRAGVDAGSKFGRRSWTNRFRQICHRLWRRDRGSYHGGVPP